MLEVDKKTFEDEVLKAEGYVFVDFFGDGCVPCQALMPFVHEMADKYGDKIKFTSLNTTKARRLAIGQKILGLPVMAIYKDGEKVEEVVKDDATQESIEDARKLGAMALFGEKYGNIVRVVNMGGYSIELCGGAHLDNTAQVGSFKIVSESGIASGVRRIEALTGAAALKYYQQQEETLKAVCKAVKALSLIHI